MSYSAQEEERTIEAACLQLFGTRPVGILILRSDNGLILQCGLVRQAGRGYWLRQAFITLYAPEQNGIFIERLLPSRKEKCVATDFSNI
jgi:hypothetical protein